MAYTIATNAMQHDPENDMVTLNRSAIVVTPKQPFLDWLRDSCEEIFEEQLAGWYTDESAWPRDRGFDVFRRWFDYQHHSMLIDLSGEPLIGESD